MNPEQVKKIEDDLKKRKIPAEVKKVVSLMLDKKAEQVVVLKLKGINEITDYMILCTGNSSRQNHAIFDDIQVKMKKLFKTKAFSVEGGQHSEWLLLDYINFIVHIFSDESRKKYAIEKLWMDAKRYNFYID